MIIMLTDENETSEPAAVPAESTSLSEPAQEAAPAAEQAAPTPSEITSLSGEQTPQGNDWVNFMSSLPDDIKEDPSLKKFNDMQGLAKSYVHAERMIGADKILVPNKHATKEDWRDNVWKKLGLPEDAKSYDLKVQDGYDAEFLDSYKKIAHAEGILPGQAQGIMEWFNQVAEAHDTQKQENLQHEINQGVEGLKKEWGEAFDHKLSVARAGLKQFADKSDIEYLEKTGLNTDPRLIRIFSKVGEGLSEDSFKGESKAGFGDTPESAAAKINGIFGDKNHAYHDKGHASHDGAVEEMKRLFGAAYR
jgi:hypothetical protein